MPTLDHARGEVMAQLQGNEAVALHHGLGGGDGRFQERHEVGIGAGAIDEQADVEIRRPLPDGVGAPLVRQVDHQGAGVDRPSTADVRRNPVEHRRAS